MNSSYEIQLNRNLKEIDLNAIFPELLLSSPTFLIVIYLVIIHSDFLLLTYHSL